MSFACIQCGAVDKLKLSAHVDIAVKNGTIYTAPLYPRPYSIYPVNVFDSIDSIPPVIVSAVDDSLIWEHIDDEIFLSDEVTVLAECTNCGGIIFVEYENQLKVCEHIKCPGCIVCNTIRTDKNGALSHCANTCRGLGKCEVCPYGVLPRKFNYNITNVAAIAEREAGQEKSGVSVYMFQS